MRLVFLLAGVLFGTVLTYLVAVLLARLPAWRNRAPAAYRYLLAGSVASALLSSAVSLPLLIEDRAGPVGIVATVAPPLLLSLVALVAGLADWRGTTAVLWVVAVVSLAYMVVYGLGLGFFYLPTAGLIVGAAIVRSTSPTGSPQPPLARR